MNNHPVRDSLAAAPNVPSCLPGWMGGFRDCFTQPVWQHVLVLVAGAILATGRRTVGSTLRAMGLSDVKTFTNYHRVLNRDRWNPRDLARRLLILILAAFVPDGPVVVGIDDTIERRWGKKIKARAIYRDPVRSSDSHFVKTSGLRWLAVMVLAPIPWARRNWALPFLTVLAPSERYNTEQGRRHKTLTDWARQSLLQVCRWLPGRRIIAVADSAFAAITLIAAVRVHLCFVTRLRLDASLFDRPPARTPGKRGRTAIKGKRQKKLVDRLKDKDAAWKSITVTGWYGQTNRRLEILSDVSIWYSSGLPPQSIRWVLVRDPEGQLEPQAFLCTDLDALPAQILAWFVMRWQVEVTFQESRAHLGIETQRQWSDLAIARSTPALLGLFSLVTLWATSVPTVANDPRRAAWYSKNTPTFVDAIAVVRRVLWLSDQNCVSTNESQVMKIPRPLFERLAYAVCYAA